MLSASAKNKRRRRKERKRDHVIIEDKWIRYQCSEAPIKQQHLSTSNDSGSWLSLNQNDPRMTSHKKWAKFITSLPSATLENRETESTIMLKEHRVFHRKTRLHERQRDRQRQRERLRDRDRQTDDKHRHADRQTKAERQIDGRTDRKRETDRHR